MSFLEISLFGPPSVRHDGNTVTQFRARTALALLAYLVMDAGTACRRETLAGMLWPEHPPSTARNNLRQALNRLRNAIGDRAASPRYLDTSRTTICFNPASQYELDVQQFERAIARSRQHGHEQVAQCETCLQRLEDAAGLYRGDFMEGFSIDSRPFETWMGEKREQYHHRVLTLLYRLTDIWLAQRELRRARRYARRQLEIEPWREEAHRQLMRVMALDGQRSAALSQYQTCREILAEQFGVAPAAETISVYEMIRAGTLQASQDSAAGHWQSYTSAGSAGASSRHALPSPSTPFFGRRAERAALAEQLNDPAYPLVTIVGAGGVGKTRLALAAAHQVADQFRHGVWFVPLASIPESTGEQREEIVSAIADALHFNFSAAGPTEQQLIEYLRRKEVLLVLDNFDHLVGAADVVVSLIEQAPDLTILVTSRERLNYQIEYAMRVDGLPVPADVDDPAAVRYSSVQLFAERADRVPAGFELAEENLPHVVCICRQMEGLPLAIELAASLVETRSCAEIVELIRENVDAVSTSMRDMPARHRSLRAVFEYSWRRLTERQQRMLALFAAFRGDFGADAAREVADATEDDLQTFVIKSLLRRTDANRYALHTIIRRFATEKMQELDEDEVAAARHGRYYLRLLQRYEPALRGERSRDVLATLRRDADNIRAAWQWAVRNDRMRLVRGSVAGLAQFYRFAGLFQESEQVLAPAIAKQRSLLSEEEYDGQAALGELLVQHARLLSEQAEYNSAYEIAEEALDIAESIGSAHMCAAALIEQGEVNKNRGQYSAARAQLRRAVSSARVGHDEDLEAVALVALGSVLNNQCKYSAAATHFRRALRISREISDYPVEAQALNNLGILSENTGEYEQARRLYRETLSIYRTVGDKLGEIAVLNNLGVIADRLGDYAGAREYYNHSLRLSREVGDRRGESQALNNLGAILLLLGEYDDAYDCHQQSLAIKCDIGDQSGEGWSLINLALLFHRRGENREATAYARDAVDLTELIDELHTRGYALTFLGHALHAREQYEAAGDAYRQALELRRDAGQQNLAMEPLAGLARVALDEERYAAACDYVDNILRYLEEHSLAGVEEPFRVYLTCYRTLSDTDDPRAYDVLSRPHTKLQEHLTAIGDDDLRQTFIAGVPARREIMRLAVETA